MIYEFRLNIFVENQGDLVDVQDKLDDLKPNMKVINPDQPDQECSVIELIECYHDESPHKPCPVIDHWDNCPIS